MHLGLSWPVHRTKRSGYQNGIVTVKDAVPISRGSLHAELNINEEGSELDLINRLTDIVRKYDPDILAGYEVQSSSWGYVIERARMHFGYILPKSPTNLRIRPLR